MRLLSLTVLTGFLSSLACSPAPVEAPPASAPAPPPPEPPEPPKGPSESDLLIPTDPFLVVERLVRAERAIRDPSVSDEEAGRWGHVQQRVYRALANDGVLADAVSKSLPPDLIPIVSASAAGTRQIGKTVTRPQTDLPNWRIIEARPMRELEALYKEAAQAHGVPWTVLAAIHLNETRMGRLRGVSPAGARGPMQFMPATWEAYGLGGDIEDDRDAIFGAAHYVSKSGWAKDPRKAIWAYNHSEAYIDAILAFAGLMDADANAYRGYWGWQVYYRTVQGSIWLSPGYEEGARVPIESWCAPRGEPWCPKVH